MQAIDIDTNADLYYNFTSEVSAYNMAGQLVDVQVYNYLDLFRIDSAGQVFVNGRLDVSKVQRIIYGVQAIDRRRGYVCDCLICFMLLLFLLVCTSWMKAV